MVWLVFVCMFSIKLWTKYHWTNHRGVSPAISSNLSQRVRNAMNILSTWLSVIQTDVLKLVMFSFWRSNNRYALHFPLWRNEICIARSIRRKYEPGFRLTCNFGSNDVKHRKDYVAKLTRCNFGSNDLKYQKVWVARLTLIWDSKITWNT